MKTKLVKSIDHIRVTFITKPHVGHPGKWLALYSFTLKRKPYGITVVYEKEKEEDILHLMELNATESIERLKNPGKHKTNYPPYHERI